MVPGGTEGWRESIERPIGYGIEPPFTELAELVRTKDDEHGHRHEALGRVVDALAGLTAVDGATLITDRYELLAFGVKIGRADGRPRVERVVLTEPVEGGAARVLAPLELGGTRHMSAAQFAQDQHDAVRARRLPGRALHRVRLVRGRGHGARPPGRGAAALTCRRAA